MQLAALRVGPAESDSMMTPINGCLWENPEPGGGASGAYIDRYRTRLGDTAVAGEDERGARRPSSR